MHLVSFYISFAFMVGACLIIYQLLIILLLAGTLFRNKVKTESYNLLYVFNTLAAWSSLAVLLTYVGELFMAWYGQNSYEWFAFTGEARYFGLLFFIQLLSFVFGLLLFFRRLRISRLYTLFFFLSSCGFLFERLVIFITNQYRDYIPSSWPTNYKSVEWRDLYAYGIVLLLLILIYLRAKKKGRLPFPSVFLK